MKTTRSILLLSLLAACSSPAVCGCAGDDGGLPDGELPSAFRVDAEIVSVVGVNDTAALDCTPRLADQHADGPDWQLQFDRMHDADEPTFKEWTTSSNGDSAARCQNAGGADCCRPLTTTDGGWRLECDGRGSEPIYRRRFVFDFATDGSGTATSTATAIGDGSVLCTSTVEWSAIVPL